MITDNNTTLKLLTSILIVTILLGICITVDNADTEINNIKNTRTQIPTTENITIVNETHYQKNSIATHDGKIHTDKTIKKNTKPTVTMWARPSVRSHYSYKWYKKTFIDYCPHCHKYNVLYNAHKWQARYEQEWTCRNCGADFCAVTGKEKYDWSHYYLTQA